MEKRQVIPHFGARLYDSGVMQSSVHLHIFFACFPSKSIMAST